MRILKFTLPVTDHPAIEMPWGCNVLCAQAQHDAIQVWAECDDDHARVVRHFAIYGTGNPVPGGVDTHGAGLPGRYIGTVQLPPFVWHVYELR